MIDRKYLLGFCWEYYGKSILGGVQLDRRHRLNRIKAVREDQGL